MRTFSSTERALLAAAGIPPAHYGPDAETALRQRRPGAAVSTAPPPPTLDAVLTAPGEVRLRWGVSAAVAPQGFFVEWQDAATETPDVWNPYALLPATDALVHTHALREMPPGHYRFRVGMQTAMARVASAPVTLRISARPPGWATVSGGQPGDGRLLLSVSAVREQAVSLGIYNAYGRLAAMPPGMRVLPGVVAVLPLALGSLAPGDYTLVVRGEGWQQALSFTHALPRRPATP